VRVQILRDCRQHVEFGRLRVPVVGVGVVDASLQERRLHPLAVRLAEPRDALLDGDDDSPAGLDPLLERFVLGHVRRLSRNVFPIYQYTFVRRS
jgi:hypothetical protein